MRRVQSLRPRAPYLRSRSRQAGFLVIFRGVEPEEAALVESSLSVRLAGRVQGIEWNLWFYSPVTQCLSVTGTVEAECPQHVADSFFGLGWEALRRPGPAVLYLDPTVWERWEYQQSPEAACAVTLR